MNTPRFADSVRPHTRKAIVLRVFPKMGVAAVRLNNRCYQDEAFRQQQNAGNPASQGSGDRYRQTIDWRTIVQDPVSKK